MSLAAHDLPLRRRIIQQFLADPAVRQRCEQYVTLLRQTKQRDAAGQPDLHYAGQSFQAVAKPIDHDWERSPMLEAIIRLTGRPTVLVSHDTFTPADAGAPWQALLTAALPQLQAATPSVGRIEVRRHPGSAWAGTGFVVAANVIATNSHVAKIFAGVAGAQFAFHSLANGTKLGSAVDFRREAGAPSHHAAIFDVNKVLYMAGKHEPDMALLEIDWQTGPARLPLTLGGVPAVDQTVAVIGHPGWNAALGKTPNFTRLFSGGSGVKRIAPGKIIEVGLEHDTICTHDCSTLGGNSGSAMVDLATGRVLGLHFAGRSSWANYAVQAPRLRQLLVDRGYQPV